MRSNAAGRLRILAVVLAAVSAACSPFAPPAPNSPSKPDLHVSGVPAVGDGTGTVGITGTVVDTAGGVIPGATVRLIDERTGQVRGTTSDWSGSFAFRSLAAGAYTIETTLDGFKPSVRHGLKLEKGILTNICNELQVGALEETVTIRGDGHGIRRAIWEGYENYATRSLVLDREPLLRIDTPNLALMPSVGNHIPVAICYAASDAASGTGGTAGIMSDNVPHTMRTTVTYDVKIELAPLSGGPTAGSQARASPVRLGTVMAVAIDGSDSAFEIRARYPNPQELGPSGAVYNFHVTPKQTGIFGLTIVVAEVSRGVAVVTTRVYKVVHVVADTGQRVVDFFVRNWPVVIPWTLAVIAVARRVFTWVRARWEPPRQPAPFEYRAPFTPRWVWRQRRACAT